ncbi:hypothetical protein SAMN05192574_109179 [Mucilaginibacter gossypiicola]|uniref:Uncharacterized protein n=1 Tax=Mucilaginibacter gossypiicola TaxID=551995 RepID=A0A1H8QW10_9SPHI|nr:hypothetical protein [Mucilaginibacter gossypiicola]SEO58469.1 hypothetical protein SAMN05192574_109179 [Mucilaginibacter gossypiicola]
MKQEMLITQISPDQVGEFISESFYQELTENFQQKFPTEVKSVMLSRAAVETALSGENVSGIKFMNGLEDANDPSSRMLVLIPCNYTVTASLPNSIIKQHGFMTNTGQIISLERTWQVLFNHVLNFKKLDPAMSYTQINRGAFMGRILLTEFLAATTCDSIIYHFGYLVEENLPYKLIIQPADGIKMFGEMSVPCPGGAGCPAVTTSNDPCALTQITTTMLGNEAESRLNLLRTFRDKIVTDKFSGVEVEKYYTISASLLEAIDKTQNKEAIFKGLYDKYIASSLNAISQNDEETAFVLFQEAMQHLTETYLYQ